MPTTCITLEFDGKKVAASWQVFAQAPAMYELLKELQWCGEHHLHYSMCPVCWAIDEHEPDCRIAAVLKAVEGT